MFQDIYATAVGKLDLPILVERICLNAFKEKYDINILVREHWGKLGKADYKKEKVGKDRDPLCLEFLRCS